MNNITFTINEGGRGEVWIDGVKIDGLRSIQINAGVDELTLVKLTILARIGSEFHVVDKALPT